MARTSRRVARRTSRGALKRNSGPSIRMRVPEIEDESELYEQADFDDEEEEREEEREVRRAFMELPYRKPVPNTRPSSSRPSTPESAIMAWVKVTYAPGTPVMFIASADPDGVGAVLRDTHPMESVQVPVGARGEVSHIEGTAVIVKIVDARDDFGARITGLVGSNVVVMPSHRAHALIEPLVDNWATKPSYRTVAPHRVTAGRWRTSRPMRPNAWPDWDMSRTRSGGLVFREKARSRRR